MQLRRWRVAAGYPASWGGSWECRSTLCMRGRRSTAGWMVEKHSGCGSLARKTNHSNGGAKSGLNGKEIDGSQFYVIKIPINAKTARSTAWELALSFSMRHHRSGNTTPAYMCGRFPVVCQWVAKRAQ